MANAQALSSSQTNPLFFLLLNTTKYEHGFPWNLFFSVVSRQTIPHCGSKWGSCSHRKEGLGEAAAVVLAQRIPLDAGEGRRFPQKPQGEDLFLPPVSWDSSGDVSHLTIKCNKREEQRYLNPFHSKIFLNRYNCTAPLNAAFFSYPAFKSGGNPLQLSLTKYLLSL